MCVSDQKWALSNFKSISFEAVVYKSIFHCGELPRSGNLTRTCAMHTEHFVSIGLSCAKKLILGNFEPLLATPLIGNW